MKTSESKRGERLGIVHGFVFLAVMAAYAVAHHYAMRLSLLYDVVLTVIAVPVFTLLFVLFFVQVRGGERPQGLSLVRLWLISLGVSLNGFLIGRTAWAIIPLAVVLFIIFLIVPHRAEGE